MKAKIQHLAEKFHQDVISIRRHIHQYPELSFEEKQTGLFISQKLRSFGIQHDHGMAENGVVGLIKGKNPEKKVIALRADIDALPIQEANEASYRSKRVGVMHACGHDVHTASLLGTAKILDALKEEFEGTVKLIFQPGEELLPGGASIMIREGVLDNPKPLSILGQHVHPPLEAGKVGFCPGKYMASTDELHITVTGKGGHGAMPQKCIDPILMSSHIIVALQQMVSRYGNPLIPSVLTIGKINSTGGATNVIPNEVKLLGTFRTMDETWRREAHNRMTEIAENIARGMGGVCDFEIRAGYPNLFNDEHLTHRCREWAVEYLGEENVIDLSPQLTAEDFAFYAQAMPACFYRFGISNDSKGINSPVHTNTFDVDEDCLIATTGLMAWMAIKELS